MFQPPYDDSFKASALTMLDSAGYPAQRGSLIAVSRALGVPRATLRRWVLAVPGTISSSSPLRPAGSGPLSFRLSSSRTPHRGADAVGPGIPPPGPAPLVEAIRAELLATLASMAAARSGATYKELSAGFAVLAEKLRQVEPPPEGPVDTSPGEYKERLTRLVGAAAEGDPQGDS